MEGGIDRSSTKVILFLSMYRPFFYLVLPIFILFGTLIKGSVVTAADEPTPKVYLNHFYLIVDSSAYKDIVESYFIKNEFAHFEERTTVVNNDESYTGAYVYGENTYFEFFEESNSQDFMPTGLTSGMAFGVEKKDEIKIIQKNLKAYKNAYTALRTRGLDGAQIPWCTMSGVVYEKTSPDIMTWVMEYHEDFLKKWHPDLDPSAPGITRNHILKRYAAKIAKPDLPKDKILKDIIEVNLKLNQKDLEMLTGELAVFGYAFSQEGNKKIYTGPDVKIIIDTIDSGAGKITGIKMSCHPNRYREEIFAFGENSRLVLHADNTATWIFY
jgi:hypothetical protein